MIQNSWTSKAEDGVGLCSAQSRLPHSRACLGPLALLSMCRDRQASASACHMSLVLFIASMLAPLMLQLTRRLP